MKNLKKIMAGILTLIMALSMLTGCVSDPVADELEKYLNTDMVDVNANYEKIKTESGKWENLETDEAIVESINKEIIPTIDDSLDKLSKIELQTEEVKEVKSKYEKAMTTYKEGYNKILESLDSGDENTINDATAKIEEAIELIDEYNKALESLASEKGMKIEY